MLFIVATIIFCFSLLSAADPNSVAIGRGVEQNLKMSAEYFEFSTLDDTRTVRMDPHLGKIFYNGRNIFLETLADNAEKIPARLTSLEATVSEQNTDVAMKIAGLKDTMYRMVAQQLNEGKICSSNQCQNGATCLVSALSNSFICLCPYQFHGELCEKARPCMPSVNPCRVGAGACQDVNGTAVCKCYTNFAGDFCEIDLKNCSPRVNSCAIDVRCCDTVPPVLSSCPGSVVRTLSMGESSVVYYALPHVSDNNRVFSLTSTHSSGWDFPVGETTVTFTARDTAGNQAVCSFTVTVQRALPETILMYQTLSPDQTIALPLVLDGDYNFLADFGDSTPREIITSAADAAVTHTYAAAGVHTVTLKGSVQGIRANADIVHLVDVRQWGPIELGNYAGCDGHYFEGAHNMRISAIDVPDLSTTTTLKGAFSGTTLLGRVDALANWNVSTIQDMSRMFEFSSFQANSLDSWDTSQVVTMAHMFANSTFNGFIGNWDVSSVQAMGGMFYKGIFNRDISRWNTSNLERSESMFAFNTAFNQRLDWITDSLRSVHSMFHVAKSFNQPLEWNTKNFENLKFMFSGAVSFNQRLGWNTAKVISFKSMFEGADSFRGEGLELWNTTNVKDLSRMFWNAPLFNQNIGAWDTSSVESMQYMFVDAASFNQDVSSWSTAKLRVWRPFDEAAIAWSLPRPVWPT